MGAEHTQSLQDEMKIRIKPVRMTVETSPKVSSTVNQGRKKILTTVVVLVNYTPLSKNLPLR